MAEVDLSAGRIAYRDTGGSGPVLLLLHGLLMDDTLWTDVTADLARDHRCIAPTLPLGAHTRPVRAGTELSLPAVARLVEELVEVLDLREVVVVGNDTGGAIAQLLMARGHSRLAGAVLASCDAFDNVPPGLTGTALTLAARLPPWAFGLFLQQLRWRPLRRLPVAFGWLTTRGDAATARWLRPVWSDAGVRRDAVAVLRALRADRRLLLEVEADLATFAHPVLVVWAAGDRVMPPEHGRRLARLLPRARLEVVEDSATLIPLDQPAVFSALVRDFAAEVAATSRSPSPPTGPVLRDGARHERP